MIRLTARISVSKTPLADFETFVYQSGDNIYTAIRDSMIGKPKSIAIGNPRETLLRKPDSCSLTFSQ